MGTQATGLTTDTLVEEFAQIKTGAHTELIKAIIRQTTEEIERRVGRKFIIPDEAYADVLDGSGLGPLILKHTPVVEFRLLELNDATIDAATYQVSLNSGLVIQVSSGVSTAWITGTRNYRATYTAGYVTIPGGLEGIATDIVARRVLASTKKTIGVMGESLGIEGGTVEFEPRDITQSEWAKLMHYGQSI